MRDHTSYAVTHLGGCRLVYGSLPIQDMATLLDSGADDEAMDIHLASLTGATIVIGLPDALDALRARDDLPISSKRTIERDTARAADLPASFCEWLYRGHRGASSDYIAHCVTGVPDITGQAVPSDSGDFKRCVSVIDALSEYMPESEVLRLMGERSERWGNLSENWSTLKDMSGKSGLQCSDLIQKLIKQGSDYA